MRVMKLLGALNGAAPAIPDYDMLRAALAVAQAAMPTARRTVAGPAPCDRHAALNALVTGDAASFAAAASSLGHCFAGPVARDGAVVKEGERRLYRGVSAFLEAGRVDPRSTTRRAPGLQPRAADRG